MASYGIKDPQHSRLEDFDDWIIKQILIYGDAKIINKYFNRYKLKKIRYKRTSSDKDSFEELIENFFKNENLRESFIENCEEDNHRFWEYYNNIFKNILTLVSICDIEPSVINKITKQLIDFLERETVLNPASYGSINTFLNRCGKNIENELIQSFFNLGIKNRFLHDSEFFYTLSSIVKKREVKIEITPEQFTAIRNISFEECNLCKEKHNDTNSIHLYSMINDTDFLKEIENHILIKLEKDFSFDLFYQATLFDLIPLNNSFLNKAIEFSLPKSDRISFKSVFSGIPDNRFENVECILNLCFKFNIDTTTSEFVNYKKLDPYYDWLVDMENYNYELFDPSWIGRYRTRFYFRQIHNSKTVKQNLDYLIKDKFDNNLERDYINIYVRKTWNVKD